MAAFSAEHVGAVQHRVLGVVVQMDEGAGHGCVTSGVRGGARSARRVRGALPTGRSGQPFVDRRHQRERRRALRVDVVGRRVATAGLVRDFHRAHPDVELDVVTLYGADAAVEALASGTIDATFRAVTMPGRRLPDGISAVPVLDEPLRLFTGPAHPFACVWKPAWAR